jgi:hypothetical protein
MVEAVVETRRVDEMTARFIIAIELGEISGDVIEVGESEGDGGDEVV